MAGIPNSDSQESPPHFPQIFPSVHESELSEKNKKRGRCSFSQFFPKKIRRRQSTCSAPVTSSTGCVGSAVADEFADSHVFQPRPISDFLLVKSFPCNLLISLTSLFLILAVILLCILLKILLCCMSFNCVVLFGPTLTY